MRPGLGLAGADVEGRAADLSQLHVTLAHAFGIMEPKFGDPEFCTGPISGLSVGGSITSGSYMAERAPYLSQLRLTVGIRSALIIS